MGLLKQQKVDLFSVVGASGFSPSHFTLDEGKPEIPGAKLTHQDEQYFFSFERKQIPGFNGSRPFWEVTSSPGRDTPHQVERPNPWNPTFLKVMSAWLARLRKEISTPDPWAVLKERATPPFSATTLQNTPFSVQEWERTSAGIEKIRTLLLDSVKGQEDALRTVNSQLDTIIESGKSMGRKDWFNHTVGALVSTFLMISAPPEVVRTVWEMLKSAVAGTVDLIPSAVDTLRTLG